MIRDRMRRLAWGLVATALLAGCASYRAPALPAGSSASLAEQSRQCEAWAKTVAGDGAVPGNRPQDWLPTSEIAIALAPILVPVKLILVKRDRERAFSDRYDACMAGVAGAEPDAQVRR